MLVAEACMLYGWLPKDCLTMAAVTFFSMLDCGIRLHAMRRIEECDLAFIGGAEYKYYEGIRGNWQKRAFPAPEIGVELKEGDILKPPLVDPAKDKEGARLLMFSFFSGRNS